MGAAYGTAKSGETDTSNIWEEQNWSQADRTPAAYCQLFSDVETLCCGAAREQTNTINILAQHPYLTTTSCPGPPITPHALL